jgi:protein O-mannosyl-transferase
MPRTGSKPPRSPARAAPAVAASGLISASDPRVVRALAGVLIICGLLAYANSFAGVFLFDDVNSIVENPNIRSLWPLSRSMSAPPQATVAGRPLISLTLALNYALGGLDPRGYHAFNLIAHLLCGLLLFGIVRRTLSSERLRDRFGSAASILAWIIAVLWLVHPLQTESVTYVIQRTESLMGLFYLLTLYCFLRGRAVARPAAWDVAAVTSCALGMTCKEVMVTAPLMVLLYDRIFVADSFRQIAARRRGLYLGLAASWIILVALIASGPRSASVGFSHSVGALGYARNQCIAIITYLKLSFWPRPLVLDYGTPQELTFGQVAPYAAALAALLVATVLALTYRPRIGFLAAWFLVILAPTSSFVPITTEVAAERRVYLPLAAIIAFVVLGLYELISRRPARGRVRHGTIRTVACGTTVVVACVLGVLTRQRNAAYHDEIRLWPANLAVTPDNARVHHALGKTLVAHGQVDEGIAQYRLALQLDPDLVDAHFNLGNAFLEKERYAEAVAEYEAALQMIPNYARVQMNLGIALVRLGEYEQAVAEYKKMLRFAPGSADIHGNLAVALFYGGRPDEAIAHLRDAVRLAPHDRDLRGNLAGLLLKQGRPQEAIQEYQEALRISPDDAALQAGLNEAMTQLRDGTRG